MDCSPPGSSVWHFPCKEYWSGLPFPPPGELLDPGINPRIEPTSHTSPALAGIFFITEPSRKPKWWECKLELFLVLCPRQAPCGYTSSCGSRCPSAVVGSLHDPGRMSLVTEPSALHPRLCDRTLNKGPILLANPQATAWSSANTGSH